MSEDEEVTDSQLAALEVEWWEDVGSEDEDLDDCEEYRVCDGASGSREFLT